MFLYIIATNIYKVLSVCISLHYQINFEQINDYTIHIKVLSSCITNDYVSWMIIYACIIVQYHNMMASVIIIL